MRVLLELSGLALCRAGSMAMERSPWMRSKRQCESDSLPVCAGVEGDGQHTEGMRDVGVRRVTSWEWSMLRGQWEGRRSGVRGGVGERGGRWESIRSRFSRRGSASIRTPHGREGFAPFPLALADDTGDLIQPTIGAGRLLDDIAAHLAGATALAGLGSSTLHRLRGGLIAIGHGSSVSLGRNGGLRGRGLETHGDIKTGAYRTSEGEEEQAEVDAAAAVAAAMAAGEQQESRRNGFLRRADERAWAVRII